MAAAREGIIRELVAQLIAAPDAAAAQQALLAGARAALASDRAVLLRSGNPGPSVVDVVPAGGAPVPADSLSPALEARAPITLGPVDGYPSVLALGLRTRGEPPW